MCDWNDLHDHANDARDAGCDVEEVVFEGSGHCQYFQKDPARYIEAVGKIWIG